MQETLNYLKKLTSIVSPTGYTKEIADYLVEELSSLGYTPMLTNKGGVNVVVEGKYNTKTSCGYSACRYIRSYGKIN